MLPAKGYSNRQLAIILCLTEHTVKAHVSALFAVLNAGNRIECVDRAQQRGLLTRCRLLVGLRQLLMEGRPQTNRARLLMPYIVAAGFRQLELLRGRLPNNQNYRDCHGESLSQLCDRVYTRPAIAQPQISQDQV